jgi:hypothetical protein
VNLRRGDDVSDVELVRSLDDQERVAALECDVAALERLWSDAFTVNAPNNQVIAGRGAVLDTFVRSGIMDFASFERHVEFVAADRGFIILMGLETLVPNSDAPGAGLIAAELPHGPLFGVSDFDVFHQMLGEAGFRDSSVRELRTAWRMRSIDSFLAAFGDWGQLDGFPADVRARIEATVRERAVAYRTSDGFTIPNPAILLSAAQ